MWRLCLLTAWLVQARFGDKSRQQQPPPQEVQQNQNFQGYQGPTSNQRQQVPDWENRYKTKGAGTSIRNSYLYRGMPQLETNIAEARRLLELGNNLAAGDGCDERKKVGNVIRRYVDAIPLVKEVFADKEAKMVLSDIHHAMAMCLNTGEADIDKVLEEFYYAIEANFANDKLFVDLLFVLDERAPPGMQWKWKNLEQCWEERNTQCGMQWKWSLLPSRKKKTFEPEEKRAILDAGTEMFIQTLSDERYAKVGMKFQQKFVNTFYQVKGIKYWMEKFSKDKDKKTQGIIQQVRDNKLQSVSKREGLRIVWLGAGRCQDVDIKALLKLAGPKGDLFLVDIDPEAIKTGLEAQVGAGFVTLEEALRLHIIEADVMGGYGSSLVIPPYSAYNKMKNAVKKAELIISSNLVSQLLFGTRANHAENVYRRYEDLIASTIVKQHMSVMKYIGHKRGIAIIIFDLPPTEKPLMPGFDRTVERNLKKVDGRRRFITGRKSYWEYRGNDGAVLLNWPQIFMLEDVMPLTHTKGGLVLFDLGERTLLEYEPFITRNRKKRYPINMELEARKYDRQKRKSKREL